MKNKTLQKIVSLSTLAILTAVLSACGSKEQPPAVDQPALEQEEEVSEEMFKLYESGEWNCYVENAFNLERPVHLMLTYTIRNQFYAPIVTVCSIIDAETGEELAVDQGNDKFCMVDYLDATLATTIEGAITAEYIGLIDDPNSNKSKRYDYCERVY